MNAIRKQPIPLQPPTRQGLVHARVLSTTGATIEVQIDRCVLRGQTAFSCLVAPQQGDLVLCDCTAPDRCYILSVLERPQDDKTVLRFPGDVVLQARSTTLVSEQNLNFLSGREIHKSAAAVIDVEEVTATGNVLQASYRTVRLISELVNTMARHVVERMKTYLRQTEDHDQLHAGQMTRKTEGCYCLETHHTIMVSRKDTKIDGERIHMG